MNTKNQDETKDDIMKELGFDKLSQDKQDDILAKIGEIILKKIFIETVDKLSDEDSDKFKEMLKGGESAEGIENFLSTKIKNYDIIIGKIVEDVKRDIKNN